MKHIKWDDMPYEKLNDKFLRKIAYDGELMIGLTVVEQGYVVTPHSHPNTQMTFVSRGRWRFTIDGKTTEVGPNEMVFIPANIVHSAEAIESLVAYDVFTPPRADWLSGDDRYLRANTP